MAALQEHAELVAAFQQHMQRLQQQSQGSAPAGGAAGAAADLPVEASQRAVIRSLASQVSDLQRRLEQATGDWEQTPPAGASAPTDAGQLVGMLVLLKQQLAGLERIQQQLEAAPGSPSLGGMASDASPGGASSAAAHLSGRAHAAALLGTELPALQATVGVMEGEVRRMAAAVGAAADAEQHCSDQGELSTDHECGLKCAVQTVGPARDLQIFAS